MVSENEAGNLNFFRDCLSNTIIERLAPDGGKRPRKRIVKGRKNEIKPVARAPDADINDAAELSEFVEYLGDEIFSSLPDDLRILSYATVKDDSTLLDKYALPLDSALLENIAGGIPPTLSDSLVSYRLIKTSTDIDRFIEPALTSYITATAAPPPEYTPGITASRPSSCEICQREHLPLTYHHLIPRQMHAKAVKRGWHKDWELNKVAWLCRACHSYVHQIATNEELAREWFDVDLLLGREDVQRWAHWIGRIRWKAR